MLKRDKNNAAVIEVLAKVGFLLSTDCLCDVWLTLYVSAWL